MIDAARLASPTGEGGILWHPATLADIGSVPSRTLLLFDFYRAGQAARIEPWAWMRVKGKRVLTHQYTTDWQGEPVLPARCGYAPDGGLERYDISHCSKCESLARGETHEATGTVAGVKVGARHRVPSAGQGRA